MSAFEKVLRVERKNLLLTAGSIFSAFLFVLIIVACVMHFGKVDTYIPMASIFAMTLLLISALLLPILGLHGGFNTAVQYSMRRKSYVPAILSVHALFSYAGFACVLLLYKAEYLLAAALWGNPKMTFNLISFSNLKWYALGIVLALAAGAILGSALQRFGPKILWIFWGVYMLFFVVLMPRWEQLSTVYLEFFQKYQLFLVGGGVLLLSLLFLLSIFSLFKLPVRIT